MSNEYLLGLLTALATGIAFAFISLFEGTLGKALGAVNATILEHLFSGGISLLLLLALAKSASPSPEMTREYLPLAALLGLLVFVAVTGIAFAFPRIGLATGTFVLVFGQITTAAALDAVGFGGYERIPITLPRLVGIGLMAAGVYFVLPKQ